MLDLLEDPSLFVAGCEPCPGAVSVFADTMNSIAGPDNHRQGGRVVVDDFSENSENGLIFPVPDDGPASPSQWNFSLPNGDGKK